MSGFRRARARKPPWRCRGEAECSVRNLSLYDVNSDTGGKADRAGLLLLELSLLILSAAVVPLV